MDGWRRSIRSHHRGRQRIPKWRYTWCFSKSDRLAKREYDCNTWNFTGNFFDPQHFCYTKIEGIVRMSKENEDDEIQDKFDQTFDFWGNIGLAGTSVIIYLSMAAYAFQMYRNMKSVKELLISSGIFLFIVIVCGFYQVAAIKQIRRKEPLKQGDAADRNFEKIWLSSCDEGEKKIIFEAGYKAFSITRIFLLVATLIAMLGETFFDGGLTAVVLLTACNIFMTLVYTYFSIKLGK